MPPTPAQKLSEDPSIPIEERLANWLNKNKPLITSAPAVITSEELTTEVRVKLRLPYRSTLTAGAASQFKPTFDAIINSNFTEDHDILYATVPTCSPGTLYVKLCDALKYYIWEAESRGIYDSGYHKISEMYKNSRVTPDRIRIERKLKTLLSIKSEAKEQAKQLLKEQTEQHPGPKIEDFRKRLLAWFNDASNYDTPERLKFSDKVSGVDKEWMDMLFGGVSDVISIEYVWHGESEISVVKSKIV